MRADEIKNIIKCGETSTVQFKQLFKTAEDIANELVAFSNSRGGRIFIGINDKTGEIVGLNFQQLNAIGSLVAAAARDRVHPSVFPIVDTVLVDDKAVMIVSVQKGADAPYSNNKGEIYVKQGPDKRRVSDNNEILRLFHDSGNYQPDRAPVRGSSINDLDNYLLLDYFENILNRPFDKLDVPLEKALQNLFILDESGEVTLGGLMFFGKRPQRLCPAFNIKAVWFFGNDIGGNDYHDSKNIDGTIPRMFDEGMRFLESCLHRVQAGQNFNSIGVLEVSEIALRELLQNALVHRSWLKPAPIRILIFDNRVEIVSPGALPSSLTVDDIKLGNAFQRNQLIANFCAKTMDYRGLGSGILRALKEDPNIQFFNEASGDQFRVIFWRTADENTKIHTYDYTESQIKSCVNESDYIWNGSVKSLKNGSEKDLKKSSEKGLNKCLRRNLGKSSEKSKNESSEKKLGKGSEKSKDKIVSMLSMNSKITIAELAAALSISDRAVSKHLKRLQETNKIRRVGPDKGGHWEVFD